MGARRAGRILLAISVPALLYFGWIQSTANFHTVVENELYRSAQPTPRLLAVWADRHGVRTVINLRGPNPDKAWYRRELAASGQLGMVHIDFAMSSGEMLDRNRALELIRLMRDARKPILIHCAGGADRSGLASALYVAAIAGGSEALAEMQLTPLFGHFPVPWLAHAYSMDETFEALEPLLGYPDS